MADLPITALGSVITKSLRRRTVVAGLLLSFVGAADGAAKKRKKERKGRGKGNGGGTKPQCNEPKTFAYTCSPPTLAANTGNWPGGINANMAGSPCDETPGIIATLLESDDPLTAARAAVLVVTMGHERERRECIPFTIQQVCQASLETLTPYLTDSNCPATA